MATLQEQQQQQTDLQQAKDKLAYYQQRVETERNPDRRDKYIEYVNAWRQGVELVREGHKFSSVSTWAGATASGEYWYGLEKEKAEMEAVKQATAGMSGIEKSQYESFVRQGYSALESAKLTSWSSQYQMSPSPTTAKKIIAGVKVVPAGAPQIAPEITPKEQFFEKIGLEKKQGFFGDFYGVSEKAPTYAKPYPLTISAYEGATLPIMQQTWWESTKQALGRTPTGFQMSMRGAIVDWDVGKGLRYVFEPFKYSGKLKGEEKLFVAGTPQFGTYVSEEYLPSEYKPFV